MLSQRISVHALTITPFTIDGRIDIAALHDQIDRLASHSLSLWTGCGAGMEGLGQSDLDSHRILEHTVEAANDRVAIIAIGIEPSLPEDMTEFMLEAYKLGATMAQIEPPRQLPGDATSLVNYENYLRIVLESVDAPCAVNFAASAGQLLQDQSLARLMQSYDHLRMINFTETDFESLVEVLSLRDEKFDVIVSNPIDSLSALALGAQGFRSLEANIAPTTCAAIAHGFTTEEFAQVTNAYANIAELSQLIANAGGVRAVKGVMRRLGLPGGYMRSPHLEANERDIDAIMNFIDKSDIPSWEGW
ncbi:MAG: hypothetical protein RLZZ31_849 [Actinomycetota bacterium]